MHSVSGSGHPTVPNIEGREHIITSDDAFFLEKLPKKVVIVGKGTGVLFELPSHGIGGLGGGYIATEFACIFNGFGSEVTMVLRGKTILTAFDQGLFQRLTLLS